MEAISFESDGIFRTCVGKDVGNCDPDGIGGIAIDEGAVADEEREGEVMAGNDICIGAEAGGSGSFMALPDVAGAGVVSEALPSSDGNSTFPGVARTYR